MHRIAFIVMLICGVTACKTSPRNNSAPADPSLAAALYQRAPDTLPGTLPEMRDPQYWISRMERPDEVILTSDRIEAMNRGFEEKMRSTDPFSAVNPERKAVLLPLTARKKPLERAGRSLFIPDIRAMRPEAAADTVRDIIRRETAYLRSIPFGNMYAVEYSPREIDSLESEMALGQVPDKPEILDGVTVRHTRIRIVPSHHDLNPGMKENTTIRAWDMWNLGVLRIGRPVWALHASKTGMFIFVLSDEGYGWVASEDVAFGRRADIARIADPKEFVVCCGDRVPFYSDSRCRIASGTLRMGDRAPLAERGNPRIIHTPLRRNDGSLAIERAWLAEDSEVRRGWLPYTRRNIVTTAFKLLDNPYDWTGAWMGRSHETTWRDIFACFGFRLPYQGELFTHFGDCEEVLPVEMSREERNRRILAHEPFITLMVSWEHAQLLLGGHNGIPIVFDNHGYDYKTETGELLEIKRTCVGDTRQPWYFYDHPVTFLEIR